MENWWILLLNSYSTNTTFNQNSVFGLVEVHIKCYCKEHFAVDFPINDLVRSEYRRHLFFNQLTC